MGGTSRLAGPNARRHTPATKPGRPPPGASQRKPPHEAATSYRPAPRTRPSAATPAGTPAPPTAKPKHTSAANDAATPTAPTRTRPATSTTKLSKRTPHRVRGPATRPTSGPVNRKGQGATEQRPQRSSPKRRTVNHSHCELNAAAGEPKATTPNDTPQRDVATVSGINGEREKSGPANSPPWR